MNNDPFNPHFLRRLWILVKFVYLYLSYFLAGLDNAYFYAMKGKYFDELNLFGSAIPNYEKALKESNNPTIHLWLASSLLHSGRYRESIDHFQVAYHKYSYPHVALGLAIAEYETGNIDRSRELVQQIKGLEHTLNAMNNVALGKLQAKLEQATK